MKIAKIKMFIKHMKTKINYEKKSLNLNPNIKHLN